MNRLWAELLGRGFVEPVDDFNAQNPASHEQTLDYLADEFVASGFDLRVPIRLIVGSQAYARGHAAGSVPEREAAERAFVAQPRRRMLSESLFDSIVLAGHLFEPKHEAGENIREVTSYIREAVPREGVAPLKPGAKGEAGKMSMAGRSERIPGGYDLESAIEVDFDSVLADAKDSPAMEAMEKVKTEDLEEVQMMNARVRYVERKVTAKIDDNPKFTQSPCEWPRPPRRRTFYGSSARRRVTPWASFANMAPRCGRP